MPYIGKSPHFGVRNRFIYTASGSETSKSGADDNGATLTFTDGAYVDVYLNGVLLKPDTDYVTSTANTIGSLSALAASDILEVIVYDVFSVSDTVSAASGGTFQGAVGFNGGVSTALTPSSADGVALGSASLEWSDLYLADGGVIYFGNDQEITLTHSADDGLILKHVGTGDGKEPSLTFQAGDNDIAVNDVLGSIFFQAPDEGAGTDAILVSAAIEAVSEGDFSASSNVTSLVFKTGASEAAAEKMRIMSDGDTGIGTSAPAKPLHVKGGSSNGTVRVEHTSNSLYTDHLYDGIQCSGNSYWIVPAGNNHTYYEGSLVRNHVQSGGYLSVAGANGSTTASSPKTSGAYHQIKQTNNDTANIELLVANGSFTSYGTRLQCDRASGTAFMHLTGESDGSLVFKWRGDGAAIADAAYDSSGADYAEYFEWKDGNSSDEDRVGCSVVLDGNQIKKATSDDDTSKIIGIVSATPAVIGDGGLAWNEKYLKDDFGRKIMEDYTITTWTEKKTNDRGEEFDEKVEYHTDRIPSDVTVPSDAVVTSTTTKAKDAKIYTPNNKLQRPKLNPDYDDDQDSVDNPYKSREFRKEWSAIGLTGKLRMKKGQPTGDRWIKMRDISDTVEEWLVR